MKKLSFVLLLNCLSFISYAQIYTADNGLATTGSGVSKNVKIGGTLSENTVIDLGTYYKFTLSKSATDFFNVQNDGMIGVGTSTPASKLHVHGGAIRITSNAENAYLFNGFTNGGANDNIGIALHDGNTASSPYLWIAKSGTSWGGPANKMVIASTKNSGTTKDLWIYANDNLAVSVPNILIQANTGRVGIGTVNTGDANFKLFVETGIRTRKVKVDQSTWPDYVFTSGYKLRSLRELELFIKAHKHLPDVPSANSVSEEGLDLGDNQATLLKKIEELTLYLIEQNKLIESQNQKLEKQQHQINDLLLKMRSQVN